VKNVYGQKKGLALVQKNLRCACGKGQMTRDNDAWEEREKKIGPPVEEKEKKHKTKTTKLPTITAIVKDRPAPPQKLRELESHFLSRRTSPPDDLADKYGPLKTKNVPATAAKAPTLNKRPSANLIKQQPISKPAVKSYAPVEPKPKRREVIEEPPIAIPVKAEEKENNNFNNYGRSIVMGWKEPSQQQPSSASAADTLFPHHHFSYNSNPNLKNALVQTDETNFPAALASEPGLVLYNSKESFDSGLGSVPRSWKDSDSRNSVYDDFNSGRSSVVSYQLGIPYGAAAAYERYEEFTKVSFVFLIDGRYGIEIDRNGQKEMLRNIFGNELRPLYLSWVESIEIGETAQYHRRNFSKHVVYDILNIIGKPLYAIRANPEWDFEVVDNNGGIAFQFETPGGLRRVPEETVLAAILKKMRVEAEDYLNEDINEICLSTNFAVTESQRNVFNTAALKLNLNIKLFNNV
jgi:hypothetical protein